MLFLSLSLIESYTLKVELQNKMDIPVLIVYEPQGDDVNDTRNERLVQPHTTTTTVFTVQSTEKPNPFVFRAFSPDMREEYHLNGQKEQQLQPTTDGISRTESLKITSSTSKLYHVNLYVLNKAGQKVKVQVVWDEKVGPETLEIPEGEAQNITKEIYTSPNELPNYEFQIHEYGTDKNLLINGHSSFTLTPTDDAHAVTMIEITPSPEDEGGQPQGQGMQCIIVLVVV